MSGDPNLETVFDSIHPGEPGVAARPPRYSKRLYDLVEPGLSRDLLSDAIRALALPRLLAAHAVDGLPRSRAHSRITKADVGNLLAQISAPDFHVAEVTVMVLAQRGASREDILLNLFTPVARQLHECWVRDELTFADVTLAIGRLQRLLRSAAMPQAPLHYGCPGGSILIAPPPGDMHAFGSAVLEDFFRNAHWRTERLIPATADELVERVRAKPFDIIALSVNQDCHIGRLALLLRRMRRESANPRMLAMVGGHLLQEDADAWKHIGADATAPDAATAIAVANKLLRSMLR
jgi:MerR family transcriptional regulator, light-induced transcriptional regulator